MGGVTSRVNNRIPWILNRFGSLAFEIKLNNPESVRNDVVHKCYRHCSGVSTVTHIHPFVLTELYPLFSPQPSDAISTPNLAPLVPSPAVMSVSIQSTPKGGIRGFYSRKSKNNLTNIYPALVVKDAYSRALQERLFPLFRWIEESVLQVWFPYSVRNW